MRDPEDLMFRLHDVNARFEFRAESQAQKQKLLQVLYRKLKSSKKDSNTQKPLPIRSLDDLARDDLSKKLQVLRDGMKDTRTNVAWHKKLEAKKGGVVTDYKKNPNPINRFDMGQRYPDPLLIDPDAYQGGGPRIRSINVQKPTKLSSNIIVQRPRISEKGQYGNQLGGSGSINYGQSIGRGDDGSYPTSDECYHMVTQFRKQARSLEQDLDQWKAKRLATEIRTQQLQETLNVLCQQGSARALLVKQSSGQIPLSENTKSNLLPYTEIPGLKLDNDSQMAAALSSLANIKSGPEPIKKGTILTLSSGMQIYLPPAESSQEVNSDTVVVNTTTVLPQTVPPHQTNNVNGAAAVVQQQQDQKVLDNKFNQSNSNNNGITTVTSKPVTTPVGLTTSLETSTSTVTLPAPSSEIFNSNNSGGQAITASMIGNTNNITITSNSFTSVALPVTTSGNNNYTTTCTPMFGSNTLVPAPPSQPKSGTSFNRSIGSGVLR